MTENEQILMAVRACRRVDLFVDPAPLTPAQEKAYRDMCTRRAQGEPLQYIIGHCDFAGVRVAVDPRVLVPRPETELLVERVLEQLAEFPSQKEIKILDLGTGSGNIAIALAKAAPYVLITAVDVSQDALAVARRNLKINGVADNVRLIHEDMQEFLVRTAAEGKHFDLIVSNPPYIPTAQLTQLPPDVQWEPQLALDGGEDGMTFYRAIIAQSPSALAAGGFLFLEIGDGQAAAVQTMFEQDASYAPCSFFEDYTRTRRIVRAQKGNPIWKN